MSRYLPIVGFPVESADVAKAFRGAFDASAVRRFMAEIGRVTHCVPVFAANSGSACFYAILETLKRSQVSKGKVEVVLAAYTAPSLVVTIRKAGLKPVLCDILLDDFNADPESVLRAVTRDTLVVCGVHMFGIPWSGIAGVKKSLPVGVTLVEDCAQAFGAKVDGSHVGTLGHAGFFSFNRGKNFPTLSGGIAVSSDASLAAYLKETAQSLLKPKGIVKNLTDGLKCASLRFAFDPGLYGALRFLIAPFKETRVPSDIALERYSSFQAAFGLSILERGIASLEMRSRNGLYLSQALRDLDDVSVPAPAANVVPVFNRLPVLFKDPGRLLRVQNALERIGIESSRMYLKPLHHIFDLGYGPEDFPNAVTCAQRLLTLPVHPLVRQEDLDVMVKTIRKTGSRI